MAVKRQREKPPLDFGSVIERKRKINMEIALFGILIVLHVMILFLYKVKTSSLFKNEKRKHYLICQKA